MGTEKQKLTDEQIQEFAKTVANPEEWFALALQLRKVAQAMGEHFRKWLNEFGENLPPRMTLKEIDAVYLMLMAFAVEDLVKGAYVKKHHDGLYAQAVKTEQLPKKLSTHYPNDLLEELDVSLDSPGAELLQRLAVNGLWWGRYPTPTSAEEFVRWTEDLEDENDKDSIVPNPARMWMTNDYEDSEKLFSELCEALGVDLRE